MSYANEFVTVDLIQESDAETRGVDSFALSLIKCEKQMRRIFTHIIFQYPCFDGTSAGNLRDVLANNKRIYFDGFIQGFDSIYPRSIQDLIGSRYSDLRSDLKEATNYRNKIFHGQLTKNRLTRGDLFAYVDKIRSWCSLLADAASREIGFDGFERETSFFKSNVINCKDFKIKIGSISSYEMFIRKRME